MSKFGTLIQRLRSERGIDLPAMAAALQAAPGRLAEVEAGTTFPPAAERRRWATALGFTDLLDLDHHWRDGLVRLSRPHPLDWIPIINAAPAGIATDYHEFGLDSSIGYDYVPRANTPEQQCAEILFAVILIGDSMAPTYHNGDLVIFRPVAFDELLPNGSPVFIRFTAARDHTCTFKRLWRKTNDTLELRPDNSAHTTLVVPTDEIERLAVAVERRVGFALPSITGER